MSAPLKEGYVPDHATGRLVDGRKPEEKVRQEYELALKADHDYDFRQMDIEVFIVRGSKTSPKSDEDRADIVIYKNSDPTRRDQNADILGIVECKRPQRTSGVRQLMSYMSASSALWGVWTNGDEIEYLYKDPATGEIKEHFVFRIPSKGESFEDIGRLSKKDLKPATNLKPVFRRILNVLYANTNISRKEKLGAEMIRLLFCKIWDEKYDQEKPPKFKIGLHDKPADVKANIEELFDQVKAELVEDGVFEESERIVIEPRSIAYVVGELEQFSLLRTDKDVVGDAFEVFAERRFVGEKGEFFTPRDVVKMCVNIIDPKPRETVFDPACGSGGFLIYALGHIWQRMDTDPKYRGSPKLDEQKREIAERSMYGIDKEIDLVKVAKAYMAIVGDGRGNVLQENTLHRLQDWQERPKEKFTRKDGKEPRKFDIILTNPPFGSKIKVIDKEDLAQFDLAHKWVRGKDGRWTKTNRTQKTPPQLLFLERCLDFLKDGGRMAIVLPEGVFGNPTQGWVRQYVKDRAEILAIIDCPAITFQPHTHTKTSVLIVQKWGDQRRLGNYPIFCGIVRKCGHDPRGNDILNEAGLRDEEFSELASRYNAVRTTRIVKKWDRLGFTMYEGDIVNDILIPRYYNPDRKRALEAIEGTGDFDLKTVGELRDAGVLSFRGARTTIEPDDYQESGAVPFVRTSDIGNWEINVDIPHWVSEETWARVKDRQNIQPGDILFVKDGTFLIGDSAVVTAHDPRILVQLTF